MPTSAAQHRDQQRLGHQLPGHAARFGAEREANRQFLLAGLGAHQEQVGDVRTRDQQHQSDGAEQNPQHGADVADDIDFERPHQRCEPRIVEHLLGKAGRQLEALGQRWQQALDVGVGLRNGHAGLEPRQALEVEAGGVNGRAVDLQRKNHLRVGGEKPKVFREHADHFVRIAVDRHALPDG